LAKVMQTPHERPSESTDCITSRPERVAPLGEGPELRFDPEPPKEFVR